jgi:hypothetical protein
MEYNWLNEKRIPTPIMHCSNKISVPLTGAVRELKMISHKRIPKASNAIQLQKHCLKGPFLTQYIVQKRNFGAITHLESRNLENFSCPLLMNF